LNFSYICIAQCIKILTIYYGGSQIYFTEELKHVTVFFCLFAYPQLSTNLILNIDANKISSYGGSGNIINDLSLSGNHHRIVNDVTHIADLNGYSSFNFGGSPDYLKLNSAPFNDLFEGTNYTIVILVNLLVSIFQV
tara:strand:- start:47 stop:457 length:411 start_codon:yes stop_codon:yes gene_type:complete